jgi:hypothetical protein
MDPELLPRRRLVELCRQKGWKLYSRLKVAQLRRFCRLNIMRERVALRRVMRWLKDAVRRKKEERKARGRKKRRAAKRPLNTTDFATLEPIAPERLFRVDGKAPGTEFHFDFVTLLQHVLTSGHTTNPFNREELGQGVIRRLEAVYRNRPPGIEAVRYELHGQTVEYKGERLAELQSVIAAEQKDLREREEAYGMIADEARGIHATIVGLIREFKGQEDFQGDIRSAVLSFHLPRLLFHCRALPAIQADDLLEGLLISLVGGEEEEEDRDPLLEIYTRGLSVIRRRLHTLSW